MPDEVRYKDARSGLQLKAAGGTGEGVVTGYASLFDVQDSYGDVILPGAFDVTLDYWRSRGEWPVVLWGHSRLQPVGKTLDLTVDKTGLLATFRLSAIQLGQDALTLIKEGAVSGLSIGFYPTNFAVREEGWDIHELHLVEYSLVAMPALADAQISQVRAAGAQDEELKKKIMEVLSCLK